MLLLRKILSSGRTAGCSEVKMTTARARCGNDETGKQQGILRADREDESPPAAHFVSPFWRFPWWESLTLPVSCLRFSSYSSPLIRCLNITHTSNVQHASTQQNPAGLTGGRFNARSKRGAHLTCTHTVNQHRVDPQSSRKQQLGPTGSRRPPIPSLFLNATDYSH